MKTFSAKGHEVKRDWFVIDATDKVLGRVASEVARRLRGNVLGIPMFRFAQFIGAWQGFRQPNNVSAQLLEHFYYPPDSANPPTAPEPGRKIQYSDDT